MSSTHLSLGFMQGRLSPLIGGRIQAFPWPYWEDEFALGQGLGLSCMEWTLDRERIYENPLMTEAGRARIAALSRASGIAVPSLTGDFCMQAPFWTVEGDARRERIAIFEDVLRACGAAGIGIIVVPLVDNGAITSEAARACLERTLLGLQPLLHRLGLMVAFESDFPPARLAAFIGGMPADRFGINFDMGNSASLGWDAGEEIGLLAPRIVNVHVKDRPLGGTTVPLGQGAVDFPRVFGALGARGYAGNYILQTARATDDQHVQTLRRYADFVTGQLSPRHGA